MTKKKRRILIIILVILIILLIGIFSLKLFYNKKDNKMEDWGSGWIIDYKNKSHGISINDEHTYNNLVIKKATFNAYEDGMYTFVADLKNNGTEELYHTLLEIEFLDKDNKVLFVNYLPVKKLEPSDTARELRIVGDSTIDMRKFTNYRISNIEQTD